MNDLHNIFLHSTGVSLKSCGDGRKDKVLSLLIAQTECLCAHKSLEEVREILDVNSLAFLSERALYEAGRRSELCLACFNGHYPTYLYQSIEEANKDGKF